MQSLTKGTGAVIKHPLQFDANHNIGRRYGTLRARTALTQVRRAEEQENGIMKSDVGIWQVAADMITQDGSAAELVAVKLANLMLDYGDRERQVEWLRIWTAIVLLRQSTVAAPVMATAA
jgi:hypothetical protein